MIITWCITKVCALSRRISVLFWIGGERNSTTLQWYVALWLGLLIVFLGWAPVTGAWRLVILAASLYRLQDLLFSSLDNALDLTGEARFPMSPKSAPVLMALVNIVQIVLIFAIAFAVLTTSGSWSHPPLPFDRASCFFLSWSSISPLQIASNPMDATSRTLTIVESGVAAVIVLIALGRFISLNPPRVGVRSKPQTPDPSGTAGGGTT